MPTVQVGGSAGWDGLSRLTDSIRELGDTGPALTAAMEKVGGVIVGAAQQAAPTLTGRMAGTIKAATTGKELKVTAGGPETPYAYTFHAVKLGKSQGYFTYKMPALSRRGYPVRAHNRVAPIPNNPFLFTAWENNAEKAFDAYKQALFDAWGKTVNNG